MSKILGIILLTVGRLWVEISTCATGCVFFLVWLGILVWLFTSTWGGFIWAGLWLFLGGSATGLIVGVLSAPMRLFGVGLVLLGTNLLEERYEVEEPHDNQSCRSCGALRSSLTDEYCTACGARYE